MSTIVIQKSRAPSTAALLPRWSKHVVTKLGGRDPLGLSRLAQFLTDYLLTGIVINTDRARYYALYTWILWHVEQEHLDGSWEAFQQAFQRREAAIALATLLADPESSPVGKRAVSDHLAKDGDDLDTQFKVLPANDLGGFGQYYGGSLHALGLTMRREAGADIVNPQRPIAVQLAEAVHATVVDTPYVRDRCFDRARVSRTDLTASAARLGIDGIALDIAGHERDLLIDLFFGFDQKRPDPATTLRRRSLARLLVTVQAYNQANLVISDEDLGEALVFAPSYFGVLAAEGSAPVPFAPPASLVECTSFWRQFCLHGYLTLALEGLLAAVLQVLEYQPGGLALDAVLDELLASRFVTYAAERVGGPSDSPRAMLSALGLASVPDEAACSSAAARMSFDSAVSERVYRHDASTPAEQAARSCVLLAVLYARWRASTDRAYAVAGERGGAEPSAPSVLPRLDTWFDAAVTWRDVLHHLVTLLVTQHDRVMYDKGRLDSCWLHRDGDLLVRDQDCEPTLRSSRHTQAAHILVDLGVLTWAPLAETKSLILTSAGEAVLARALAVES